MEACSQEWKEWSSLKGLTEQIPQQFQYGLRVSTLKLTCLDAYPDHLVIGTNAGLVYLAHLPSFNLIRLKCENISSPIRSVVCVSSVDDMIAAGCSSGIITIFQIPHVPLSNKLLSSQDSEPRGVAEPVSPQRFTIRIHKAPITAMAWGRNGMRLFSGDTEGTVCLVQVDYERQQCEGIPLLLVESRVVQMSYAHQKLAVSYGERCIIYNLKDNSRTVVGKKPRIPPGLYGCTFASESESPNKDILYCARPSQRIWSANTSGEVLFSYIQKKLLQESTIPLLNRPKLVPPKSRLSFGFLYHYKGPILVSYSEICIIILNLDNQKVLGYCEDFSQIADIAVCGDNIFVLEDNRDIICLSPSPSSFGKDRLSIKTALNSVSHENLIPATLSEIKSKVVLPNKQLMDGIAKLGETVASKLSEIATPAIIPGDRQTLGVNINPRTALDGDYITQVHRPVPYFLGMARSAQVYSQNCLNEKDLEDGMASEAEEKLVYDGDPNVAPTDCGTQQHQDVIITPSRRKTKARRKMESSEGKCEAREEMRELNDDTRPYEVFKDAIQEYESLLADVLDLSALRMDHERMDAPDDPQREGFDSHGDEFDVHLEDSHLQGGVSRQEPPGSRDISPFLSKADLEEGPSLDLPPSQPRTISFGPPSGSSATNQSLDGRSIILDDPSFSPPITRHPPTPFKEGVCVSINSALGVNTMPPPEDLTYGWRKHHLPSLPAAIHGLGDRLLFAEMRDLYISSGFSPCGDELPRWRRKRLMMEIASLSLVNEDDFILLLTKRDQLLSLDRAKLLSHEPLTGNLLREESQVRSVGQDRDVLWILYRTGKVVARLMGVVEEEIEISCQELRLQTLVCRSGVVWGLTESGRIAYRIGIRPTVPTGIEWGIILHLHPVLCIHLSANGVGWMMDAKRDLYVSPRVSQSYPQGFDGKWWQIGMSDYMLDDSNHWHPGTNGNKMPQVQMTSGTHFLWISRADIPFAFSHSLHSFVGHRWNQFGSAKFRSICAGGIYRSYGALYCLNEEHNLFLVDLEGQRVLPINLPSGQKVLSFSARPESLWILTNSGMIFIRTGLCGCFVGLKWVRLDMQQIEDVRLKQISLSPEVVWAVDTRGQVYMRQGPVIPPPTKGKNKKGLDLAWLHVDSNELTKGAVFEEVHVGNHCRMVWGRDSIGRIYVRESIDPGLCTGTSWVPVEGIHALSLSISDDKVYVVTPSRDEEDTLSGTYGGKLFVREGISPTNLKGDAWKRIPSNSITLKSVTASVDNTLWALDVTGRILQHKFLSLLNDDLVGEMHPAEEKGKTS